MREAERAGLHGTAGVHQLAVDFLRIEAHEDITLGDLAAVGGDLEDFETRPGFGIEPKKHRIPGRQSGGGEGFLDGERPGLHGDFAGVRGGSDQGGDEMQGCETGHGCMANKHATR